MNWGAFFIALGVMIAFGHVGYASATYPYGKNRNNLGFFIGWSLCISIGIGLVSVTL